jgi:hypothetical protein
MEEIIYSVGVVTADEKGVYDHEKPKRLVYGKIIIQAHKNDRTYREELSMIKITDRMGCEIGIHKDAIRALAFALNQVKERFIDQLL